MPNWGPSDIPWGSFDPSLLDGETLRLIKAAALTEFNAKDYAHYLTNVFAGDLDFTAAVAEWRREEEQHGRLLGRYAEMADPSFSFATTFDAFLEGYRIPVDATRSVRGSRTGELLARCIVETGTSSFYSAIAEATIEPVLNALARHIAADEFRHYGMFKKAMEQYLGTERIPLWRRAAVAVERIREVNDDELAFAYHCANERDRPYDRKSASAQYSTRAYRLYQRHHTDRAVAMVLRATGLNGRGWLGRGLSSLAWRRLHAVGA